MRLTEKETSILKYLYRSGTKVVGRETLLREVFGYNARVGRCALPQAQSLTQSWPEKQESESESGCPVPHKISYITCPYKTLDSKFGAEI